MPSFLGLALPHTALAWKDILTHPDNFQRLFPTYNAHSGLGSVGGNQIWPTLWASFKTPKDFQVSSGVASDTYRENELCGFKASKQTLLGTHPGLWKRKSNLFKARDILLHTQLSQPFLSGPSLHIALA